MMDTPEKFVAPDVARDAPAAKRQRLPWHAPKLILSSSVRHLTGSHRTHPSADSNPSISDIS